MRSSTKISLALIAAVAASVVGIQALGGTNTLSVETGAVIQRTHINKFQTALVGDLVPRNTSGVATTNAGSIGTTTYYWLKAFVESGYWAAGDIKLHHSYNATQGPGHGWMLADGRVVSQANYDTEHGSGAWATYIGSSPLDGKYLPDFTGRYPVGAATTTQAGGSAITAVGVSGNVLDMEHNHQWYDQVASGTTDKSWNSSGSAIDLSSDASEASPSINILVGNDNATGAAMLSPDLYTTNSGSATQSIQPDSIQVQYYVRIIE